MLSGTKQVAQANDGINSCTDSIWSNAKRWIQGSGGFVHSQLSYNESQRQVYFDPSSCSGGAVDAGTTLLRIPDACLPSLHSVETDEEFGKSLFAVVHSLEAEASLYHDAQDVVLALFLARQQQRKRQSPSFYEPYLATLPVYSTNDADKCSACNNLQLLPRQWDAETLKRRLQGTSLYKRIVNEQKGIKCEYELIKTAWMQQQQKETLEQQSNTATKDDQKQTSQSSLFPTCEQYDNMMALVTSRGFDGLGYDGVDVMIPLLDLLNHVRGHGVKNGDDGCVAHVRYERYHEGEKTDKHDGSSDGEEPSTKRIKTAIDDATTSAICNLRNHHGGGVRSGGVKVTAGQSIVANGTKLQMTYGAKSNTTLLGRYGFCIVDNVEPDGSCNDVVEIGLKEDLPPAKLRRGPKSYTYCLFVKAMELFHDAGSDGRRDDDIDGTNNKHLQEEGASNDANEREGEEDDDGGLEAFLNDCDEEDDCEDEEDEGGEDLDEMMYQDTSFGDDDHLLGNSLPCSTKAEEMMNDLRALEALHLSLEQAMERCENNSLIRGCGDGERLYATAEDNYCAILIKSEMQTISFYKKAAQIIHSKLSKSSSQVTSLVDKSSEFEMIAMDREHVNDLVKAFMTIRYPGVRSD